MKHKDMMKKIIAVNVLSIAAAAVFTLMVELMLRVDPKGGFFNDFSNPPTILVYIVYLAICTYFMCWLAYRLFGRLKAKYFSAVLWIPYSLLLMVIIAVTAPIQEELLGGMGIVIMILALIFSVLLPMAYGFNDMIREMSTEK